jgi:non-canonical purine NTP pyrophosphatase (RdgB/HAM1 family)
VATRQSPRELLIATGNVGKLREIEEALHGLPMTLRSLKDFPPLPPAHESGHSYIENATIKAKYYAGLIGKCSLADDSGLEVEALNDGPGIHSARFGTATSDRERIELVLAKLSATNVDDRKARFVCVITLADPISGLVQSFEGEVKGTIAQTRRGTNGFGYDAIFIPDGYALTFGELSSEVKGIISHRARALAQVRSFLIEWLRL